LQPAERRTGSTARAAVNTMAYDEDDRAHGAPGFRPRAGVEASC
jgi:hypothetical protein